MWPFSAPTWETIAQEKVAERAKALQTALPPDPSHLVYLHASASEIVTRIGAGEWTASEVLEAYISRAALAQEATNCLTEVCFAEARKQAQALDACMRDTKRLAGPLHGVPVSFKDVFDIAGCDTTMGHTARAHQPAAADAEIVRLVRAASGIPLAKTNVPQTLMFWECVNPTWGRTAHPRSAAHTAGGSSGGEAALLAADGAALGLGNDVGGSVRIPAAFCGVFALKPGWARGGGGGARENMPGFDAVRSVMGPMARTVADLELACRVMFGRQRDDDVAPLPFREVKLRERLRFGYYVNDGYVKVSPPVQRAVLETVEALRRAGHECVEITVPEPTKALQLFLALTLADGNKTLFAPIGQDPRQVELTTMAMGPELSSCTRSALCWALNNVMNDPQLAEVMKVCKSTTVTDFWAYCHQQKEYCKRFNKEVWDEYQIDGIIAPVVALPPLPHKAVTYIASLAIHSLLYNVLDLPAGTVPVTRVDAARDALTPEWTARAGAGHGSPTLEGMLYRGAAVVYDADAMAGLPVGVQVVGRRWEEEKVLGMMRVVDRALGPRACGPGSWSPAPR